MGVDNFMRPAAAFEDCSPLKLPNPGSITVLHIYMYVYMYIYSVYIYILLTPRSTVLLEKLTGSAASQEILRIFGTRRFITVLTSARHLSLS